MLFRKAREDDLKEIVRLLTEDDLGKTRESPDHPNYLIAFEEISKDLNQLLMVIEKEKKIIGTCHLTLMPSLTFTGSKRMNIEAVRIDKSMRGQKLGEWMIKQAIAIAHENNCKIIQLSTNKSRISAKKFYESLGFSATHEGMKMYI